MAAVSARTVAVAPVAVEASVARRVAAKAPVAKPFLGSKVAVARTFRSTRAAAPLNVVARDAPWLPGLEAPAYLDGTLSGDNGFDPLGLGKNPDYLNWFVHAEVFHGRTAMAGVAGVLIPDLLSTIGILDTPVWAQAGAVEYFAPASSLFWVQFLLSGFVEHRRLQDILKPGSVNQDPFFPGNKLPDGEVGYPGGIFDPLGYSKGGNLKELKEKEIANGRLAMLAFIGFQSQYILTGVRPTENLFDHLADPFHVNVITNHFAKGIW